MALLFTRLTGNRHTIYLNVTQHINQRVNTSTPIEKSDNSYY